MNFRITTLFFALLLTMLWAFGYMIAHKKSATDPGFIMLKLNKPDAKDINHVQITRTEKGEDPVETDFSMIGERWFLNQKDQKVKVLGVRVEDIVKNVKSAKHDETADVSKDAKHYGLDKPRLVVKITGKYKGDDETWELRVGNESQGVVYVQTPERGDKVFAVSKKTIDNLFFKDANTLRDKRLFDYADAAVTSITAKMGTKELDLQKRGERWYFENPKLGLVGFESEQEEPKDPHKKQPFAQPAIGGVKGLLKSIKEVRVEDETTDFVPLGKAPSAYGLDKPTMRIEVSTKTEGKDAKKSSETLVVGGEAGQVGRIKYWYAQLEGENGDNGVMKISDTWLNPVRKAINEPEKLRSLDIADFDVAKVDAFTIKRDSVETPFFKLEEKDKAEPKFPMMKEKDDVHWSMVIGGEKKRASDDEIKKLLDVVHGKRGIVDFPKGTEAEQKKMEADWKLDNPAVTIAVYIDGIEKKKEEKKEEKKDERKDDKKDPKKEDKKEEVKKDEPKKDAPPALKKDYKAEITLALGKVEGDNVYVRRTLKDGTVTYFQMKKTISEMTQPSEGIELAFLDKQTPTFSAADAIAITLRRATDKEPQTIELESRDLEGRQLWHIKEKTGKDTYSYSLADSDKVNGILLMGLSSFRVNKWAKKYDEKADADKMKDPPVKIEITFKKLPNYAAAIIGQVALAPTISSIPYGAIATAPWAHPAGETVTIEFGKETDVEKEKSVFGRHSGAKDLLFLVLPHSVKTMKELDLRDRTFMLLTQPELDAFYLGSTATNPLGPVNLAGLPYVQGNVHNFDPEQVKEVRLMIRTPAEVRKFVFVGTEKEKPKEEKKPMEEKKPKDDKNPMPEKKDDKDKDKDKDKPTKWTWTDKSPNLDEFQVDSDRVATLIKDIAKLRTDRFVTIVGGPRPEHKLTDKEAKVKLELVTVDGKTITVIVGADFVPHGHFATSSVWLGEDGKNSTVFFVPRPMVDILLRGTAHFAKERTAGN